MTSPPEVVRWIELWPPSIEFKRLAASWGILVDQRADAVVRAVVTLCHVLGLTTVVEGIENAETAALVRDYGCDVGQGYYFSRPVTSEELLELLRRQAPASAKSS
jgi:EAL domain-containing protein (putative c-di-GMP-specific phosphodiesterase class I)